VIGQKDYLKLFQHDPEPFIIRTGAALRSSTSMSDVKRTISGEIVAEATKARHAMPTKHPQKHQNGHLPGVNNHL
jgi:hypothetical protein